MLQFVILPSPDWSTIAVTDLRVEIHPAGQPWFTGPTEECAPPAWARRATKLVRRRVSSFRSFVDRFDADPAVDELVLRIVERTHGPQIRRWCLLRWLDAREMPVVLEAEPRARTSLADVEAELCRPAPGGRVLAEEVSSTGGGAAGDGPPGDRPTIRRVVITAPPGDADQVDVRYLVDAGDPEGVTVASARVLAEDLERIGPELTAIVASARVRSARTPPSPTIRRARRLRRVEALPVVGIPVGILAFLAFAAPFVVALSAPGGTNGTAAWQQALVDRPIDEARTLASWVLAVAALSVFAILGRDAHLVREIGDRDYANYLALGALITAVGCALGAPPPIAVGLALVVAATVLRWRDRRRRGARDRFQAALLIVAAVGLTRLMGGGALEAAATWELSPSATDAQVEAWINDLLPAWADLATLDLITVVLLNVAALLPLVAYWRNGVDFFFGLPFASGVLLMLGVIALAGGWTAIVTLVVVGPTLWRTGRDYDRERFAALRDGRHPAGLFRSKR